MIDLYAEWGKRRGIPREEAKKELYDSLYSGVNRDTPQSLFLEEMRNTRKAPNIQNLPGRVRKFSTSTTPGQYIQLFGTGARDK